MALALELEHDVDQVLEDPWPGDRAVLRDMPDQDRGDAAILGDADGAAATSRTWVTPPGAPSVSVRDTA